MQSCFPQADIIFIKVLQLFGQVEFLFVRLSVKVMVMSVNLTILFLEGFTVLAFFMTSYNAFNTTISQNLLLSFKDGTKICNTEFFWKISAQFRIKPRMYVSVVLCMKKMRLVRQNWLEEN